MTFLHWLPENLRQEHLSRLKGNRAVKFPAPYFLKVPKSQHAAWVTLCPMDQNGMVVKTGPDFLVNGLIKTMERYGQPCEVEIIQ
ncbi:hypothetical protein C4577_01585 [Candidatus Parcubacteria bacterium]|nr:MAG: hypothetical protein C4577_01585 [Candidatus Parcubacteria bacterium]